MPVTVNIVVAVDVIAALSHRSPEGSVHMMDDGPLPGRNQGTAQLITWCQPGWQINWTVQQVDLQTPAVIRGIRFGAAPQRIAGSLPFAEDLSETFVWSGIVPPDVVPGLQYRYAIDIEMARGSNSILTVDTASLVVPIPCDVETSK